MAHVLRAAKEGPKYTRYGENVEEQNCLLQRDLQICYWPFYHMSYIFCSLMKNVIKNKKSLVAKKTMRDMKIFSIIHQKRFFKIKKAIFPLKYTRYGKNIMKKIVYFKTIYIFGIDHFL